MNSTKRDGGRGSSFRPIGSIGSQVGIEPNFMSYNSYRFMADAVVVFHFGFVGFVLFGSLAVLRWRRVLWLHLPAVAWGIYIELSHGLCPLTPLENTLREWGGGDAYQGGFVDHYVMPVLYPVGLTAGMQVALACIIMVLNATAYGWLTYRIFRDRQVRRRLGVAVLPVNDDAPTGARPENPPPTSSAESSLAAGARAESMSPGPGFAPRMGSP